MNGTFHEQRTRARSGGRRRWTTAEDESLAAMLRRRISPTDIGRELGRAQSSVGSRIAFLGLVPRPTATPRAGKSRDILRPDPVKAARRALGERVADCPRCGLMLDGRRAGPADLVRAANRAGERLFYPGVLPHRRAQGAPSLIPAKTKFEQIPLPRIGR